MSECSYAWDGIICKNCKADIFDLYYDLRAKMEVAEKEIFADGIVLQGAKNTLREVVSERDKLLEKTEQLESQVTVMRQGFETIKNNCEAGTDDYIWGVAHEMLEGAPTEASQKLQELEKFAELGRLAVECGNPCSGIYEKSCPKVCDQYKLCQKRAELLVEVQKQEKVK